MGHFDHEPDLGQPDGIAQLDSNGLVPVSQLPPVGGGFPGQFQLGSPLSYLGTGGFTANEVQYTRVYLAEGVTLDRMRTYIGKVTGPDKDIRMGIYTQADPTASNGVPVTRVAQTALVEADEDAVNEVALTSNYVTPSAGYYWLAIVRSSGGGQFNIAQTPDSAPAGFLSPVVRYQGTSGTALPTTASGLSSPSGSVIYVATMEED